MSEQKQDSVRQPYQFEQDGRTVRGTLELTVTREDGAITGVEITLSGDQVTEQARQAADRLAEKILEQQSADAVSGATPAQAAEALRTAAELCLEALEEGESGQKAGSGAAILAPENDSAENGAPGADSQQEVQQNPGGDAAKTGDESQGEGISTIPAPEPENEPASPVLPFLAGMLACALVCGAAAVWFAKKRNSRPPQPADRPDPESRTGLSGPEEPKQAEEAAAEAAQTIRIGQVHHMGARPGQQDSLGVTLVPGGVLAVVADGMGGLADGDKVSQTIVRTILGDAGQIGPGGNRQKLCTLAAHANRAVLAMLGPARQYQCGSTLISVLVQDGLLQWVSIGDSRICLYRGGLLIQLNREHTLEQELLLEAVNGRRTVSEICQNPRRKGLTSFVGMGELKHLDSSPRPLRLQPGDRVLLMTDGVFNTLPDAEIEGVLAAQPTAARAAAALEQRVLAHKNLKQDNFTAILLDL